MQLALNSWESLGQERTAEWRRGRTREIAISAVQDAAEEYFYGRMEDLKNALLRCFRFMPLKQGAKYFMSFDDGDGDVLMKPYYQDDYVTIFCGDCRDILPALDPVDMIFTDPPYGHNNNNNGDLINRIEQAIPTRRKKGDDGTLEYKARPICNDGPEANELVRWFFGESKRLLRSGCCCCCCCGGGGGPDPQFARWSLWMDEALEFKQMIVWDKGPMGLGWHYRRSYETILVAQKPGAACKWYDTTSKIENIIRPGYNGIAKIIPSAEQHPTEKPTKLAAHFIQLHSLPGDVILDPFMGSGTTLRAAKDLGRKAIGIEIEEKYCEIAAKRMSQEVLSL